MTSECSILEKVRSYASTSNHDGCFPFGNQDSVLTIQEQQLVSELYMHRDVINCVPLFRKDQEVLHAYKMIEFANRTALYAARQHDSKAMTVGLIGLVCDEDLIDWRDVIRALCLINACAAFIGYDIEQDLVRIVPYAAKHRAHTIKEGFLVRSVDDRSLRIAGYEAVGTGPTLYFRAIS